MPDISRLSLPRLLSAASVLVACVAPTLASQSGQTYFAHGAQTAYAAMLPPPGATEFYGYTQYYDAGSVRDANGNPVPGIKSQAIALAPRVVHSWMTQWRGFTLSSGAYVLADNVGLKSPSGDQFKNGPVNWGIEPLYLTRSLGAWHFMAGPVLYFPLGSYDRNSAVNTTLDRFGGALNAAVTWTPTPRWDLSLNYGFEIKGPNRKTHYRDGDQFGFTYGLGYRPFDDTRWDFGFSGYFTEQIEDDHQSGHVVPNSRLRKFAIGPKLGYWFSPASAVILQWHKEYFVQNAAQGSAFWVMFAFPLGS